MNREFKYDVAFSFVAQDEALVEQLNELLKGRLRTFMYAERQREVAGTDGEKTFGAVYSMEARVVVVLHRKEWGSTPWTRIEETAIRNRGYEDGYDFAMFIPVDAPPSVPAWLPKNRMWISRERWGTEAAAAVIEARVQEAGGIIQDASPAERALQLSRRLATQKKNEQFLNTEAGVKQAQAEIEALYKEIESALAGLSAASDTIKLAHKREREIFRVSGGGYTSLLHWQCQYINSLNDSALHLSHWKGAIPLSGEFAFSQEKEELGRSEWHFCLSLDGKPQWREAGSGELVLTREIAKRMLEEHFKSLEKHERSN